MTTSQYTNGPNPIPAETENHPHGQGRPSDRIDLIIRAEKHLMDTPGASDISLVCGEICNIGLTEDEAFAPLSAWNLHRRRPPFADEELRQHIRRAYQAAKPSIPATEPGATDTLVTARRYFEAGLNLLPVQTNGSKAPALKFWKFLQARRNTDKELVEFFSNGNGIAAIGGKVSGNLEDFDFDDAAVFSEWQQLVVEHLGPEFWDRLLIVQTPRPGFAVITRCEEGVEKSQKLAWKPNPLYGQPGQAEFVCTIETKAEGGYFLLPGCPLPCHETRRPYTIIQGSFDRIPKISAAEREVLLTCARSFDFKPREAHEAVPFPRQSSHNGTLSPGNDFNQRGPDWADILKPHGYKFHSRRGEASYWTRPGKATGISCSTNFGGHDYFYNFSSNTPFDVARGYSKFRVYALLGHAGDFSAAAKDLAQQGYGAPLKKTRAKSKEPIKREPPNRGMSSPEEPSSSTPNSWPEPESADMAAMDEEHARIQPEASERPLTGQNPGQNETSVEPNAWAEPEQIKTSLRPVPLLDARLIPEPFQEWITDISGRMGCPIEFAAASSIVVTAAVVGAGCAIRPKQRDDWTVVPNIWGGVVGRPGIMLKSPALQEVMRPLDRLSTESREAHELSLKDHEAELELFKARKEATTKLMRSAVSGKKTGEAIDPESAKLAFKNLEEPVAPRKKRYKTNDATIEKLGELLRDNPRGILVFRDELIGLFSSWDREDHAGDRPFYLECWNGTGSYEADRIGRGSIYIPNACISILGGIQPSKLISYLYSAMRDESNDGFVQRLQVLVYPDEPELTNIVDRYPNTDAKNRAYSIIRKLSEADFLSLGAMSEDESVPYFHFDDEAQGLFYLWFDDLNQKVRRQDEEPIIAEHLVKYRSLMPSLALLFHLIDVVDGACPPGPIPALTAKRAMAWCDFLETHARRIYSMVTDIRIEAAARLARKIEAGELANGFTARDVYRKCWSLLDQKDVVEAALDELVSRNWLLPRECASTGGRTTTAYVINPRLTSVSSVSAPQAYMEEKI